MRKCTECLVLLNVGSISNSLTPQARNTSTGMKVGHIKRKKIFVSQEKLGWLAWHSCTIMFLQAAVLQFLSPRVDSGVSNGQMLEERVWLVFLISAFHLCSYPRLPLKTSLNLPLAPANFCIKMEQDPRTNIDWLDYIHEMWRISVNELPQPVILLPSLVEWKVLKSTSGTPKGEDWILASDFISRTKILTLNLIRCFYFLVTDLGMGTPSVCLISPR